MVKVLEQTKTNITALKGLYYNKNLIQEKFKLPKKDKYFQSNFFSTMQEFFLLSSYFLRDQRFRQIASVLFKLLKKNKEDKTNTPTYLKEAFFELGSTFIKIGQFLSSRTDLLPKEYIEALSDLQDSVPPIEFKEIKSAIEYELRKPLDEIFQFVNPEPIASASIGQVHKATLINNIQVVVKIQRPNLQALFYQDLAILRCLATFLERNTKIGKEREWIEIIDEIGKTLFEEIDFIEEGRNADRFRKNLRCEGKVCIPRIFWQYTTRKLITIEFVPGIKITDVNSLIARNLNPKEIALNLINIYFKQFFEDGLYHADPHPGNLVVKPDGTIVFYDFGMVGRITENIKLELTNVLISVINNDTETLMQAMERLDLFKKDADIKPIKRIIEQAAYKYYNGAKLNNLNTNGIENDLQTIIDDKPMRLPSKFAYTLRATGTLEGICRTLDPEFSLVNAAKPYFESLIRENYSGSYTTLLKGLFPEHTKLIERFNDKIKIYFEVIKDLPSYISAIEKKSNGQEENISIKEDKDSSLITLEEENKLLKREVDDLNIKINSSYSVIFLVCFVIIGGFLIERENSLVSFLGFILLSSSLIGSIALVWVSIFNRKVLE